MNEYDLDVDNYDIEDLLNFFSLSGNYSVQDVDRSKKELENKILIQSEMPTEDKQKMLNFFDVASFKLEQYAHHAPYQPSEESSFLSSFENPSKDRQRKKYKQALQITKEEKKYQTNKMISNNTFIQDIQPTYLTQQETENTLNDFEVTFQNRDKMAEPLVYDAPYIDSHPIVTKPYTKFVFTENAGPYQGLLNPLERRVTTRVLSLDTRFRQNYGSTSPNNFTVVLSSPLEKVVSMRLISLELPRMWYTISAKLKNNVFFVELYNMVDYPDSVQKVEFPEGNYSNVDLVLYMNNYFTNQGQGLNYLKFDVNINNSKSYFFVKSNPATDTILPYDPTNEHYSPSFYFVLIFPTAAALASGNFSSINGSAGSRCCESTNPMTLNETKMQDMNADYGFGLYLGFKKQKYIGMQSEEFEDKFSQTPTIILQGVVISEASCGVNIENYMFLSVNDFNKNFNSNTIIAQMENSFMSGNILGRITLNSLPDTLLINTPADLNFKTREYYGPVNISKLQISLVNKFGREIALLHNDYSLALEFTILYSS